MRIVVPQRWCVRPGADGGVKLTFSIPVPRKQTNEQAAHAANCSERMRPFVAGDCHMIGDEKEISSYFIGEKDKLVYAVDGNGTAYRLLSQYMHGKRQNDKTSLLRLLQKARAPALAA